MIVIQGLSLASHAYLLIAVSFRTFDTSWEKQSFIYGRGRLPTLTHITLSMLQPALLATALFFTVVSMETFDIPVTLGLTSHLGAKKPEKLPGSSRGSLSQKCGASTTHVRTKNSARLSAFSSR